MLNAWFLARKDIQYTLRGREALLWLFVMPVIFFYFIGSVTGGFGSRRGNAKDRIAVHMPEEAGFLGAEVVRRLEENDFEVIHPESAEAFAAQSRRLTIPEGFTRSVLEGEPVTVELAHREAGLGQDYDTVRVGRAVYTVLADVVASIDADQAPGPENFANLAAMPRTLSLKVTSAGRRQEIPTGFEQAIPGILVMFTLLVLLTSGAVLLVIERRQGLLRRLASTPISPGQIVLGKWGGKMALGLVQIAFAMLAGTFLFQMQWGPDLPMVLVVLASWAAFCASLGLLMGNLTRTEGQAVGIGVLSSNVLAALGGCWWPIEITPDWMQSFARCLPTGWAMDAMHRLISFQSGSASALPHVVALLLGAALAGWAGARSFKFQ